MKTHRLVEQLPQREKQLHPPPAVESPPPSVGTASPALGTSPPPNGTALQTREKALPVSGTVLHKCSSSAS